MPRTSALAIIARVLLVPYTLALALIVWLPDAQAGRVTGIVGRIARSLAYRLDLSFSSTYTVMEFLANIVLFIPFGILLAVGWKRLKTWHLAALGLATSGVIEFVQLFLPTRFSTISDLIANTAGALVGCLCIRVIGWLASVPAPSRRRVEA
ncbi:VanZ family protein [Microbacterium sp. CH12i]|uniref:VanZ family protein n=1 Tax=Microbacterium sp. CH12i TaxID=1479651 RepID=UPI001F341DF7|nr:VanZ family protein [Microbacterium sp. CH12i]